MLTRALGSKNSRKTRQTKKTRKTGGGKGAKPGTAKSIAAAKAAKAAKEAAAADPYASAGAEGAGAGGEAAAPPATLADACLEKSMAVIQRLEKNWSTMREDQRETRLIMVKSIDGYDRKDGQFYITAWCLPSPEQITADPRVPISFKVVVGVPFIKHPGQDKAKITCRDLLKEGAAILTTQREGGLVSHKSVVTHMGSLQVSEDVKRHYQDLIAVFPDEMKKEWIAAGKLKAYTRW